MRLRRPLGISTCSVRWPFYLTKTWERLLSLMKKTMLPLQSFSAGSTIGCSKSWVLWFLSRFWSVQPISSALWAPRPQATTVKIFKLSISMDQNSSIILLLRLLTQPMALSTLSQRNTWAQKGSHLLLLTMIQVCNTWLETMRQRSAIIFKVECSQRNFTMSSVMMEMNLSWGEFSIKWIARPSRWAKIVRIERSLVSFWATTDKSKALKILLNSNHRT